MIAEILAACVTGAALGLRIGVGGRKRTCTGYVGGYHRETKHDCKALRSPLCADGRCGYHCAQMCECDPTLDLDR